MKLNWIIGGAIALSIVSCGGENSDKDVKNSDSETENIALGKSDLKTEMDSVSYALGFNIADSFIKQKVTGLNGKRLAKGYDDFLAGTLTMDLAKSTQVFQGFMMKHQAAMQANPDLEVSNEAPYMDSVSYALGVNISQNYKQLGIEGIKSDLLSQAFSDVSKGKGTMDEAAALAILQSFGQKQQAIAAEKAKIEFAGNIEEGEKFLAKNGKRPEVTTLPSGLQYEIVKEGKGEIPTMMDKVSTHYHGTLIDGTVFDSSIERGAPIEFGVGGVIAGWTEALKLMPVGSKWKLYIPYNLAYGERGSGPKIGPYSTLIFDIELLAIVK